MNVIGRVGVGDMNLIGTAGAVVVPNAFIFLQPDVRTIRRRPTEMGRHTMDIDGVDDGLSTVRQDHATGAAIYMLRTTQQHHVELSAMADVKANVLITATSILLSITIAFSSSQTEVRASVVGLAAFTTLALVFAIFAVLPKYVRERVDTSHGSRFNVLFFGHFASMPVEEYVEEIREITRDYDRIIEATARDIHGIGSYLESHKYRYLRFAYTAFLLGLVVGGGIEAIGLLT